MAYTYAIFKNFVYNIFKKSNKYNLEGNKDESSIGAVKKIK